MASVSIYLTGSQYLICEEAITDKGAHVTAGEILKVPFDEIQLKIGEIMKLLSQKRKVIPHPTDWKVISQPLLEIAKVKSYLALVRISSLIQIRLDPKAVLIVPYRNLGKGGFEEMQNDIVEIRHDPSAQELMDGILDAFGRCK